MRSENGKNESETIKAIIQRIIDSFISDEKLSEFERGQVDGLRWVLQIMDEME